MSPLPQSSCYLKLLTFAASAVLAVSGISAAAQEKSQPTTVDDKPKAADEGSAPSHLSAAVAPADPSPKPIAPTTTSPAGESQSPSSKPETPVQAPAPATTAKAPIWHRVQLRLSGSMCIACLKEMQGELSRIPGIYGAKVERPQANYFQPVSPDVASWASAVILYDSERLPIEYLRGAIKQLGYNSYHVVDRLLDRQPDQKDLKI